MNENLAPTAHPPAESTEASTESTEASNINESDVNVILLQNALQLAGFADTGGAAKRLIQEGHVYVNGEVESRRKRKLYEGDVVAVGEDEFLLQLEPAE